MGELARRMTDRGLIERTAGTGRAVWHRLTTAGQQAYVDGAGIVEGVLEETVGRLSAGEQKVFHALLVKAASG
jgi:DNA-binding MarR family transcriptional regulator